MSAATKRREPPPFDQLRELERLVAGADPPRGVVLRGEEPYFRERGIDALRARARELGWEVRSHDADRADADFSLARVVDDLGGGGLFASQSLVIVRNAAGPLAKVAGEDSPLTRALKAFVADGDARGCVALSATTLRLDHAAVKAIRAVDGFVLSSRRLWDSPPPWGDPDPSRAELVQWLGGRARDLGVRLTPAQAVYVAAATGNDPAALEGELRKLAEGGDVTDVVGWSAAGSPWAAADHLLDGQTARAVAAIETLYRGGTVDRSGRRTLDRTALAAMLTGSLVRGARQALTVASALQAGRSDADALREAGLVATQPNAKRVLARAQSAPASAWRARLDAVLALERSAKTGGEVDASALTRLALRLRRG